MRGGKPEPRSRAREAIPRAKGGGWGWARCGLQRDYTYLVRHLVECVDGKSQEREGLDRRGSGGVEREREGGSVCCVAGREGCLQVVVGRRCGCVVGKVGVLGLGGAKGGKKKRQASRPR
jgi:hypothetical protein